MTLAHIPKKFSVELKILDKRIGCDFKTPSYATEGSAGLDLTACTDSPLTLKPGGRAMVKTGIAIHIKDRNIVGILSSRSGLGAKLGVVVSQGIGVIDSDYTGEVICGLLNTSSEERTINPGDRIAQLLFVPVIHGDLKIVEEFTENTKRGKGGFGHTGK